MKGKAVSAIVLILLLTSMVTLIFDIQMGRSIVRYIVVPDDYPTIQEAINNAADGDTILVRARTYYEHVVVNRKVKLVGEEASTTIVDGNSTGHVINVVSDNVTVTGFTVQKSGNTHWPALEAGICLNHSAGCVVSGNRLIDNGFCGISLLYSQRNVISDNTVVRSSWGGIHLLTSSNNLISNNTVDSTYGGINGHASSHYNNFTDNIITNSTYGMFYHDANYNSIFRNRISKIAAEGIWLQDQVSYNTVSENNLTNCSVSIKLEGPNYNNVISGNFLANGQSGIKIQNAGYARIYNNTIVHNYGGEWDAGVRLDYAANSRIHSNLITDNWRGILLYTSSPNVLIYSNNITYNEYAVRVANGGSSYLNVSGNIVMHNRGYGIGLTGFGGASNHATISRNIIANNGDGIALGQYSSYNTILQNNISRNSYGFYIDYSTQNTIRQNNIVDNDQHVYVSSGSANTWDDGYPAGGNYWSNYTGGDLYGGMDQDLPGSDGLGDSPHIINANNLDNYPITYPWAWAPNDIAVATFTVSKNVIGQGYSLHMNLTVTNQGVYTETFNVTLYANTRTIETREVVLPAMTSITLTFVWNTSGFAYGYYTLWVCAEPVLGEADTVDNTYAVGPVTVVPLGDVDANGLVDINDIIMWANAFGSQLSDPNWNPQADLRPDNLIDIYDVVVIAVNFGKTWTP